MVGALLSVPAAAEPLAGAAKAQCPYCGVGCGLELKPPPAGAAVPIWTARGDRHHPSSQGQVCVKGATVGETLHPNRLTTPLWRERLDQPFAPISWDRAFALLVDRIPSPLDLSLIPLLRCRPITSVISPWVHVPSKTTTIRQ